MRHRGCPQGDVHEPFDHCREVEAAVETILELGEASWHVSIPYRMTSTGQRGLDVAENRVDPFERRVLRGRATTTGHDRHMLAADRRDSREAGQTIGEDDRARQKTGAGIACDLPLLETSDTTQMHFDRPAVGRRLNGGDERGLVMRATAALAGHLTAEVGIADLDPVAEGILLTALEHHLHQFVLYPPGSVVLDAEVTGELHRRQALFALREQKDGEEPLGQRKFRAMEDGAG